MVGYFIGGVIFGTVADAHGREAIKLLPLLPLLEVNCQLPLPLPLFGRKPAIFLAMVFCTLGTALSPTLALIFGTNDW